tara:strand:- start:765 stop:2864 length:2100 start_codon:yes stop_codon:yes gene_type:complete
MAIDREMLLNALATAEGNRLPGESGVTSMLLDNPDFARPSYQLPPTDLNLDDVQTASRIGVRRPRGVPPREGELRQELDDLEGYGIRSIRPDLLVRDQEGIAEIFDQVGLDALEYMKQSQNLSEEEKKTVEEKVSAVLDNVDDNEEQATKAVAAAGLAESDNTIDDVNNSYRLFDGMIEEGGLPAVQRFVAAYLAPGESESTVPEWALPATVFGLSLQAEPGDWRQAVLKAQATSGMYMFKDKQRQRAQIAGLRKEIQTKALDIYTKYQEDKRVSTKDLLDIVGKGEITPTSVAEFLKTGDAAQLKTIPKADSQDKINDLLKDFTVNSVAAYQESGSIKDLIRRTASDYSANDQVELLKNFTAASVQSFITTVPKDYSVLVRKTDADEMMSLDDKAALLEMGFTPGSIDKAAASNNATDLKMGAGGKKADYGSGESGILRASLENLQNTVTELKGKDETAKITALRKYITAYGGLTTSKTETDTLGNRTTQIKTPRGALKPEEFADKLGLSSDNPEVTVLLREPEKIRRMYPREDLGQYLSLRDASETLASFEAMLSNPNVLKTLTGVSKEALGSTPYRILADLVPNIKIPKEITISKAMQTVLQTQLIEEILQEESRFSDADREVVKQFLQAESFPDAESLKLAIARTRTVLDRNLNLYERDIESGAFSGAPDIRPKQDDTDRNALVNQILQKALEVK